MIEVRMKFWHVSLLMKLHRDYPRNGGGWESSIRKTLILLTDADSITVTIFFCCFFVEAHELFFWGGTKKKL